VTHEHLFRTPSPEERPTWSRPKAIGLLVLATALVALESELLVGSLEPALADLGLSELFVGLILIPIIGNAAEHSSAVLFALRDKVDVTLEIAIGSSTQIALFVAPALVFISLLTGHPMDFVFSTFEVAAVGLATILVFMISSDGRSNWLEGAQLTGAYVIMAISFFFVEHL
jgi:Ca2+:H+ antiporter